MGILSQRVRDTPIPVWQEGKGLSSKAIASNVVSGLVANTHPDGLRIDLEWTLPAGATHIRILRRERSFPFSADDLATVAYDGVAVSSYSDTGLLGLKYYYYTVLASTDGGATFGESEDASRVFQLSAPELNSKDYLWAHIPQVYKNLDTLNNSVLEKLVDVLGAGLNLVRSRILAIKLLNDPNESPLHFVLQQVASLGFDPEVGFDFNVSRRALSRITSIYKRKGTVDGLLDFVRLLTGWEADVVEFGSGSGARVLQTYGGLQGLTDTGEDAAITFANKTLTHPGKAWEVDQWAGGFLLDSMGNVIPVKSNTADTLTFEDPIQTGTLREALAAGAGTIPVDGTTPWRKGMTIQLLNLVNGDTENLIAKSVTGGPLHGIDGLIFPSSVTKFDYPVDSPLYRVPSLPQMEVLGECTAAGNELTDVDADWSTNQWVGWTVLDAGNVIRNVVSNTQTVITLDSAPVAGTYAIAKSFTLGATFADRAPVPQYSVYVSQRSFLYEPRKRRSLRGTFQDPFQYMYAGNLGIMHPAYGIGDVAIYVKTGTAQLVGDVSEEPTNVLTSDQLNGVTADALVGMWVNPNRSQTKLFKITANDLGTLTTAEDMSGWAAAGDKFFILTDRDALRYKRLLDRVREFVPKSSKSYVFFE